MPIDVTPLFNQPKRESVIDQNKIATNYGAVVNNLNSAVASIYGVDVLYFRATPSKNGEDVIFQDYTLVDVEPCPETLKVMLSNNDYAQGDYAIDIYQLNYNIPIEIQIDALQWFQTFGSGVMPQKDDIIYIPILHKIFEINSSSEVFGFMEQLTAYKAVLQKYNPKQYRREGIALSETINEWTTGVEELFGEEIKRDVGDITNDPQLSDHNTTAYDQFKYVRGNIAIAYEEHHIGSVTPIKAFYKLQSDGKNETNIAIEYKTTAPIEIHRSKGFLYNVWVRPNPITVPKKISVKKSVDGQRLRKDGVVYQEILLTLPQHRPPELGQELYLRTPRGVVKGLYEGYRNGYMVFVIPYIEYVKLKNPKNGTVSLHSSYFLEGETHNILSAMKDSSLDYMQFDVSSDHIKIKIDEFRHTSVLQKPLNAYKWYGVSISYVGTSLNIRVFDDRLKNVHTDIVEFDREEHITLSPKLFGIRPSNCDITNVRVYHIHRLQDDKSISNDFRTHIIKHNGYTIINDTPEERHNHSNKYIGQVS